MAGGATNLKVRRLSTGRRVYKELVVNEEKFRSESIAAVHVT